MFICITDVMGELCAIRSTITDRIPGAQRVMLTLRLERYRPPSIFRFLWFNLIVAYFIRRNNNTGRYLL